MEDVYTQEAKVETKEALDIATQDVVDVDVQGIISLAVQGIMDWASYGTTDMAVLGSIWHYMHSRARHYGLGGNWYCKFSIQPKW